MKNKKTMKVAVINLVQEVKLILGQEVVIKETSQVEWETLDSNLRMKSILIQIIQWCKQESH